MTLPAQSSSDSERRFLEELRAQYVDQGFVFIADPGPEHIPPFLGSYRPDAIARKPGSNIAIEVRQSPAHERSLKQIRRLFEGHSDWQFVVNYVASDPLKSLTITPASPAAIRNRAEQVRALIARGERRAAFVLAWSLLEAVLHRLKSEEGKRPRTPGTVVQTLAMLGYLEPAQERQIRPLIQLRNRIVHGDLDADPSDDEVQAVLVAVEQALAVDGASL